MPQPQPSLINPNKPVPQQHAAVIQPSTVTLPRPSCVAEFEPDGSLLIQFVIPPDMAKRFERERNGIDMAKFMWETRGLKHFENQRLT